MKLLMWPIYSYLSDKLFLWPQPTWQAGFFSSGHPLFKTTTLKDALKNLALYIVTVCNFRQYRPEAIDSFAVSLIHENNLPPHT